MTLTVFPYTFIRYASIHQQEMKAFDMSATLDALLANLLSLRTQVAQSKLLLCDQLYAAIQQHTDDKKRQQLINLKRAIFNDRSDGLSTTDETFADLLARHLRHVAALKDALTQWEQAFNEELSRHRSILQTLAGNELLRKGLLLSSPTLYAQLPSFVHRDTAAYRHKELKTEYSLLRYLTRMAFKTSPFSTFTHTGIALPRDIASLPVTAVGDDLACTIRLNNKLFDYLRLLILHHPALNEILLVYLNTTIQQKGTDLRFLASYRNIESFQKMQVSSITSWLQHYLPAHGPVYLGSLTDTLTTHIPDADRSQIKSYLLQLAANGFIETGIGCSGIDPDWDETLTAYLSKHQESHPALKPLLEALTLLQQQRQLYAISPAAIRGRIQQEAFATLDNILIRLQQEAGLSGTTANNDNLLQQVKEETRIQQEAFDVTRFMLQQFPAAGIFYEDTYTPRIASYPSSQVEALIKVADKLCTLLESADTMQAERVRMRDFFLQHFGPEQQVSITDFYYTYYLEEKKKQKETVREKSSLQDSTVASQLKQMLGTSNTAASNGVIDLTADDFNATYTGTVASRGIFIQLYQEDGNLKGVVNNFLPGMGKVAGRFLSFFDPAVTDMFREWNNSLHPGCLQLELSDGSSFNANVHPPLLSYGIRIPGGHSNYTDQQLVALDKVAVKYNPATTMLSLVHTTDDREIFAYDLSLQSFFNRSNFYQLLAHFNPDRRIPLRKLIEITDEKYLAASPADNVDIVCKPRITFEKHLVLRRKAWIIRTAAIPQQAHHETDAAYYLRLAAWQTSSGLPAHVFLFLKSYAMPAGKEDKQKLTKDDYKPQYICFSQPLMTGLFRKLLGRAGQHIYLEEMLPHVSHLANVHPVTEHLIHWYKH
jgi:hypothetical protein